MRTSAKSSRWNKVMNVLGFGCSERQRGRALPKRRVLRAEHLEERALLSVCTWDGGGANNYWATAANWVGDVAPVAGDDLVFQGTVRKSTQNNLAAGTAFESITLASTGFTLAGNSITLNNGVTLNSGLASGVISLDMALGGTMTANVGGTTLTLSGVLSGNTSVTKSGSGTLALTGANTYSNGTSIDAGVLKFDTGGLGSGSIALSSAGTLQWASGNTQDISDRLSLPSGALGKLDTGSGTINFYYDISGTGGIEKLGTGTLRLNVANSYTGGTQIDAGTIRFVSNGLGTSGDISFNGGKLQWASGNQQDVSARIVTIGSSPAIVDTNGNDVSFADAFKSGTGGLTKNGTGTLSLNHEDACAGPVTIDGSTLGFANEALDNATSIIFTGGTLQWISNSQDVSAKIAALTGTNKALLNTNGNNVTFGSAISGTGGLTKTGTGTLTLSAVNQFGGDVIISGGTLQLGVANAIPSTASVTVNNPGILDLNGYDCAIDFLTGSGTATSTSTVGTLTVTCNADKTISTHLGGNLGLTQSGTGILTLNHSNDFTGDITIAAGTLSFGVADRLGSAAKTIVICDGATLYDGGGIVDLGSQRNVFLQGGLCHIGTSSWFTVHTFTISGVVSGSGTLVIDSGSSLTLAGNNTYTGGTVLAGVLRIGDGDISGSITGNISINGGGVEFCRSDNIVFDGVISYGWLEQWGSGKLTLTAASPNIGIDIWYGNLCVNGVVGDVFVEYGATLSGTGTVGDVHVYTNGIVSPGDNGIGTLTVGNLTFVSDVALYYDVQLSNGSLSCNNLNVVGTLTKLYNGVTLRLSGSRTRVVDEAIVLILNDGTDSISGIFAGLDEGDTVTVDGVDYQVTYLYNGDGGAVANDMALITL